MVISSFRVAGGIERRCQFGVELHCCAGFALGMLVLSSRRTLARSSRKDEQTNPWAFTQPALVFFEE